MTMAAETPTRTARPYFSLPAIAIAACVLIVATGVAMGANEAWSGLLTAAVFGITVALGVLLFMAIQVVGGGRWWHPLREVCTRLIRMYPAPAFVLIVTLPLGLSTLYRWAAPEAAQNHLLHGKAAWLNAPFFLGRGLVIVAIWALLVTLVSRRVMSVVRDPSAKARTRLVRTSAATLAILAITISVAFWDWTMSLEPEWFSTMYGIYGIAGALQGGVAAVIVATIALARQDGRAVERDVLHDLGKLLFAFSMFWGYIWVSQYLLIWYANLPEETGHYAARLSGGWSMLFWLNVIVNFAVPFLALLSGHSKQRASALFQVSLALLAGRWLDIHLLVAPAVSPVASVPIFTIAATGIVVAGMLLLFRRTGAPSK